MQERTLLPRSCDRRGFEDASVDLTEAESRGMKQLGYLVVKLLELA